MEKQSELSLASRRAFIRKGVLVMASVGVAGCSVRPFDRWDDLTVGLMTDLHYADKATKGTRFYRESIGKLEEAVGKLRDAKPDFVVELGDLIDAADSVSAEMGYLERVNGVFEQTCGSRHYVLGNHCVTTLRKEEFLGEVGQANSYYSFDRGSYHFVVLDACYRSDGEAYGRNNFVWTDANIPEEELEWLKGDLAEARGKRVVVFGHQRLDVSNNHGVKNAAAVREVLEGAGNVVAVFQGHSHKNDHTFIGGIHYCTLRAMVEGAGATNSGYAVARFEWDGTIRVEGFREQASYESLPEDPEPRTPELKSKSKA